jgi:hypothetical protein
MTRELEQNGTAPAAQYTRRYPEGTHYQQQHKLIPECASLVTPRKLAIKLGQLCTIQPLQPCKLLANLCKCWYIARAGMINVIVDVGNCVACEVPGSFLVRAHPGVFLAAFEVWGLRVTSNCSTRYCHHKIYLKQLRFLLSFSRFPTPVTCK